jgi:hypothetical protein
MTMYDVRMELQPQGSTRKHTAGYRVHADDPIAAEAKAIDTASHNREDALRILDVQEVR